MTATEHFRKLYPERNVLVLKEYYAKKAKDKKTSISIIKAQLPPDLYSKDTIFYFVVIPDYMVSNGMKTKKQALEYIKRFC